MKKFKNIINIIPLFSIVILISCDEVLEPEPKGQVVLDQLLTTEEGFLSVLNGAYAPLSTGGIYNSGGDGLWGITEKASDDGFTWRKETDPQLYNVNPTHAGVSNIWSDHYTGINRSNVLISRIGNAGFNDQNLIKGIEGQAKFLRALYYFNLVRFYGPIPLIVEEVGSREDAEISRSSIEAVYNQIKSDLDDAINLLPPSYSGSNNFQAGMATGGAAKALKAKAHLELEEWSEAATLAEEVINSGNYSLHDDYGNNFYGLAENGAESVFEIQYTDASGAPNANHSNFLAPQVFQGGASILPTDNDNDYGTGSTGNGIVQAFESGDERRPIAIDSYGITNFLDPGKPDGSLLYVNKYFTNGDYQPGQSPYNFPVIRYAEVLLVAAEALNEMGAGNTNAETYVNMVRKRAELPDLEDTVVQDQDAFRQAIRQERRIELCFEGNRYFDLNRWGILTSRLAGQGVTVPTERMIDHPITSGKYHLFPLPATEFINNANLKDQNPGY